MNLSDALEVLSVVAECLAVIAALAAGTLLCVNIALHIGEKKK